jgi:hypothetical protein
MKYLYRYISHYEDRYIDIKKRNRFTFPEEDITFLTGIGHENKCYTENLIEINYDICDYKLTCEYVDQKSLDVHQYLSTMDTYYNNNIVGFLRFDHDIIEEVNNIERHNLKYGNKKMPKFINEEHSSIESTYFGIKDRLAYDYNYYAQMFRRNRIKEGRSRRIFLTTFDERTFNNIGLNNNFQYVNCDPKTNSNAIFGTDDKQIIDTHEGPASKNEYIHGVKARCINESECPNVPISCELGLLMPFGNAKEVNLIGSIHQDKNIVKGIVINDINIISLKNGSIKTITYLDETYDEYVKKFFFHFINRTAENYYFNHEKFVEKIYKSSNEIDIITNKPNIEDCVENYDYVSKHEYATNKKSEYMNELKFVDEKSERAKEIQEYINIADKMIAEKEEEYRKKRDKEIIKKNKYYDRLIDKHYEYLKSKNASGENIDVKETTNKHYPEDDSDHDGKRAKTS